MTQLTDTHPRHGSLLAEAAAAVAAAVDAPASAPPERQEYPKHEDFASHAVLDALSDVICITAADGTLRYLNRAGRDLLGYVDVESSLLGCLFPAHTPAARELLFDEVVPTAIRLGSTTCDTALQTADGRVFPARQTVIATPAIDGHPGTLTIVIRDVSIERHAAVRLGESQRLFEMIARSSPDLMYLYDTIDERIIWTNRCPHAFLGGAERDARTLNRTEMHRLVHREDRAQFRATAARMAAAYGDSDVLSSEMRMRTPGGTWRWLHTRASVFSRRETGAPLLLLGIATDITSRKQVELRMLAERNAANAANEARAEFVARMTDEFRGSLHAMIGLAAEVRVDRDRRLTARERDHLDLVMAQGIRLLETVSDLHDFSAIETGDLLIEQTLVDVRDVIRDTVASFADHPGLADTPIEVALPDPVAPLLIDAVRLRQVLTHLLANALACTRDGWINVELVLDGDGRTPVAIEVEDSGPGIDEGHQLSLFSPFDPNARRAESGAEARSGTGLRLACARALCETIGGSLALVYSEPNAGSTFRITLPASSRAARLAGGFPVPAGESPSGNTEQGSKVIPLG